MFSKKRILIGGIILSIAIFSVVLTLNNQKKESIDNNINFSKIDTSELQQGCPIRDCIPSIDNPEFESATSADSWLNDTDIIFGINKNGVVRAYPQRILNWHEIVNDTIAGDPVAVTFCPLCGSALAFERVVNGQTVEFGVSGKLHNNDLVMYDRTEESLWQQLTGEAIVGTAAARNEFLTQVPLTTTTWANWKDKHPDTEVLSKKTGHSRNYDVYPYGTYEEDGEIYFGLKNRDERLHLKEVVYGVEIDENSTAYTETVLKEKKKIHDTIGTVDVVIEYKDDGEITVFDTAGNRYIPIRNFWFAWAAFHPGTKLYNE